MGYLNANGEYIDGAPDGAKGGERMLISDTDNDFAETLTSTASKPIIFGLTASELFQDLWGGVSDHHNWQRVGEGFLSYPRDVGWYGYSVAAQLGLLGSEQKMRVEETHLRAKSISSETSIDQFQISTAVYMNYMIAGGGLFPSFGRLAGAWATKYLAKRLIDALGVAGGPAGMALSKIVTANPWFNIAFFAMAAAGSIVRLGDKFHDGGNINDMSLTSMLIAGTTGEDSGYGVDSAFRSAVGAIGHDLYGIRRAYIVSRNHSEDDMSAELGRLSNHFIYDLGSSSPSRQNEESLYQNMLVMHNLLTRLKFKYGYTDENVDALLKFGDPTFLNFARMFVNAGVYLLSVPAAGLDYAHDYWDLVEADWQASKAINNPNIAFQ